MRAHLEALLVADGSFARLGPVLSACASSSAGGLNTLTPNQDRSLAGLHVDSWDGLVLTECGRGSNRLVVNIGASPRYLIFAPYEVAAITDAMGWRSESRLDVARAFLLQRDRRVYRIEVRPGEAYLAPTENLIHDASSLGGEGPDRALMLRGFLQPARRPEAPERVSGRGPADLYLTGAMRHAALTEAISILGGPGVAQIVDHRRGAANDIYRLQVSEKESLALRIGGRVLVQDPDAWQVKSVLCAQVMQRGSAALPTLIRPDLLSDAMRGPIAFLDAPTIHAYRHGCEKVGRPPWELCTWIPGALLGEHVEPRHFVELGRRLAALHDIRFDAFRTGIGPNSKEIDGVDWLRAHLRGLVTPALERRIGRQYATTLRRGNFDTAALRWRMLHGDLHAGNIIVGSDGVQIIDWDAAAVGPPEFDFAPLKHGTQLLPNRFWATDDALYASALDGYRACGGVADELLLGFGELLFLMKRFHSNHIESRRAGNSETIDAIVDLTARVLS